MREWMKVSALILGISAVAGCGPAPEPGAVRRESEPASRVDDEGRFSPTLSADLPEGWYGKESITLLSPDGQANVIASSEPIDPAIDTRRYAAAQGRLLRKEFPGYREQEFEATRMLGGRRGYVRRFSWVPPDGVAVSQVQLYYAEDGRGYTVTSTTPRSEADRLKDDLERVLDSVAVE